MFHLAAPHKAALRTGLTAACAAVLGLAGVLTPQASRASSHSDAPLIKLDPQANLTDVYAFVGTKYNAPGTPVLNVVINVHPFSEPGDGAIYDKFSDDAIYSVNIANPATGAVLQTYNFQFTATAPNGRSNTATGTPGYKNLNTILSYGRGNTIGSVNTIGGDTQNFTQGYTVSLVSGGNTTTLGSALVAPPNVGKKTTPFYNDANGRAVSGAATVAGLDSLTAQAVTNLPGGAVVFAGGRDDSFFSDIPGIFDLLEARVIGNSLGQAGGGVDGFKGYNVLTFAIQIPLSSLPGPLNYQDAFNGLLNNSQSQGVGVFASVSRPRITLRSTTGPNVSSGPFIQVNRLGNPLFNEALVSLRDKDNFNRTLPVNDVANGYDSYARTPELAVLLNAVYGTNFQTDNRSDLVAVFIPDVLRVNTTTGPARLAGEGGFSRLGFIGGDTLTSPNGGVNGGWPNGRRFGDDVIDVALTAIASGPSYSTVTVVGDNVPANDTVYNSVFPYAATPNSGTNNQKDSVPAAGY